MKRVSEEHLTRAALAKGAVLDFDGRRVNASAERVSLPAPTPKQPELPPPPPPPPTQLEPLRLDSAGLERAAQDTKAGAEKLHAVVMALVQEIKAERIKQPAPVKEWRFRFVRDDKRELQEIIATAIR